MDSSYFSTLGIPILAGRAFAASDMAKSLEIVIVNQTMAAKYWPKQDPVGKTVRIENGNRQATVVGVVADTKYSDIDEAPQPFMYYSLTQNYRSQIVLLVRTQGDPSQVMRTILDAVRKAAPELGVMSFTMERWHEFALYVPHLAVICISAFGLLAFVLAAVGLYGAVFYSVSERTREMGNTRRAGRVAAGFVEIGAAPDQRHNHYRHRSRSRRRDRCKRAGKIPAVSDTARRMVGLPGSGLRDVRDEHLYCVFRCTSVDARGSHAVNSPRLGPSATTVFM